LSRANAKDIGNILTKQYIKQRLLEHFGNETDTSELVKSTEHPIDKLQPQALIPENKMPGYVLLDKTNFAQMAQEYELHSRKYNPLQVRDLEEMLQTFHLTMNPQWRKPKQSVHVFRIYAKRLGHTNLKRNHPIFDQLRSLAIMQALNSEVPKVMGIADVAEGFCK
jgi:hypothetical protein